MKLGLVYAFFPASRNDLVIIKIKLIDKQIKKGNKYFPEKGFVSSKILKLVLLFKIELKSISIKKIELVALEIPMAKFKIK